MSRFGTYFVRFRTVRNDLTGLPSWARVVFVAVALPGIVLVALSILALVVSVVALLFVTAPVYAFLRAVTRGPGGEQSIVVQGGEPWPNEAKHVDAKVRDAPENVPDEVNGE